VSELRVRIEGGEFAARILMKKAARAAFMRFHYPFSARVDIRITDDREIRRINRDFRQMNAPTDVLSFPMEQFKEGRARAAILRRKGPVFLGDIVISAERAGAQAGEYGHSEAREFAYLTVHSMLHLLGYDHMQEDKAVMRQKEEEIMQMLELERE